jgi:hypothetical protein
MSVPASAIADAYDRLAQQARRPALRPRGSAPRESASRLAYATFGPSDDGRHTRRPRTSEVHRCDQSRAHVVRDRRPGAGLGVAVVGMSN